MNTDIKLSLTLAEVNSILQVLGQLPTSSGAWPLLVKIKDMAEVEANVAKQIADQKNPPVIQPPLPWSA